MYRLERITKLMIVYATTSVSLVSYEAKSYRKIQLIRTNRLLLDPYESVSYSKN